MTPDFYTRIEEASKAYQEAADKRDKECEDYWNTLPMEEQEKAFYSVIKRLYKGDVEDKGSYRYVLYDVFGFDFNMYVDGMESGYMTIHNLLFDGRELEAMQRVNRLEVIDEDGRSYTKYFKRGDIDYMLQDDNQTLKIFIEAVDKSEYQMEMEF